MSDGGEQQTFPDGSPDEATFVHRVSSWFNQIYYAYLDQTWKKTHWMGITVYKTPTDLWVYQEIIFETRPTVIIETGTAHGGSALFFAQLGAQLGGAPRVITIDINNEKLLSKLPPHPAITYFTGSSVGENMLATVRSYIRPDDRVMVILDSDHSRDHVLRELELYAPLVTSGCYLIVEDTNVNGHPVYPLHGPGPTEALEAWLPGHAGEFETDLSREKFMLTFNPRGYLRRK